MNREQITTKKYNINYRKKGTKNKKQEKKNENDIENHCSTIYFYYEKI